MKIKQNKDRTLGHTDDGHSNGNDNRDRKTTRRVVNPYPSHKVHYILDHT
jgi:hypothetical protein